MDSDAVQLVARADELLRSGNVRLHGLFNAMNDGASLSAGQTADLIVPIVGRAAPDTRSALERAIRSWAAEKTLDYEQVVAFMC